MPGYVEGKEKNEILSALVDTAQPGSRVHEQQKMGIVVRWHRGSRESPRQSREVDEWKRER